MDPTLTNYLGLVARCHARSENGALFFDPQNTRVRWVPQDEIEISIQKEICKEIKDPEIPILMQADDGMLHVAKAVDNPVPEVSKTMFVTLVTLAEQVSPLTQACVDLFDYPKERIEWKVGSDINQLIQESTGDVIMHIENGEYYFPDSLNYLLHEIEKGFSCVGSMSATVYNPTTKGSFLSFDDHLGITAMKWGTMMYTREFWEQRFWKSNQATAPFVESRDHQCTCVSPLEIMCFIESSDIDYLQPVPNVLTSQEQDLVTRLIA